MEYMEAAWQNQLEAAMDAEYEWFMRKGELSHYGWTLVCIDRDKARQNADDITAWFSERCKGGTDGVMHQGEFMFENEKEAMWFSMVWA